MRIFLLILGLFICITQAKANTIYNLIKIPNLEIYEINTPNKLRYFYATSSFRLGVTKNIICMHSDKETLNKKYKVINKNLNKYTKKFLDKINLRYIVLCEDLSISGINTAGIPDNIMKTLIIDIKFNEEYFERVLHHEIFHIINDSYKNLFNKKEWATFNNKRFKYAECSTCTEKLGLNTYDVTKGFFTEYSKSTASEDMAEVFSHLMINSNYMNDIILKKKSEFIKTKILSIDKTFKF